MAQRRGKYWGCSFWTRASYVKKNGPINFAIQSIDLIRMNFRGLLQSHESPAYPICNSTTVACPFGVSPVRLARRSDLKPSQPRMPIHRSRCVAEPATCTRRSTNTAKTADSLLCAVSRSQRTLGAVMALFKPPITFHQCRYTRLSNTELLGRLTLRPASSFDVFSQGGHKIGTHGEHMRLGFIEPQVMEHTAVGRCREYLFNKVSLNGL